MQFPGILVSISWLIPLLYNRELLHGIVVYDEHGNAIGPSKKAAQKGIAQVVFSRITMAAPGMGKPLLFCVWKTYSYTQIWWYIWI